MVFDSIPIYDHQDPPDWHLHQQQNLQHEQLQPVPPFCHTDGGTGGNTTGSIRPNSMSDRARLARIPHPEAALKCPRCESTDTKFCYFNNYSLSQPRHYCKTCRRYWTRGGSLRNVPVGGGCRRNKKKSRSSKSRGGAATSTAIDNRSPDHQRLKITRSSSTDRAPGDDHDNYTILGHRNYPQLPFSSSLQNLTHLGTIDPILSGQNSVSGHQWSNNMQQFPFLAGGFDQNGGGDARLAPPAIYSVPVMTSSAFRVRDQVSAGAVKMEETLKYYSSSARPYYDNDEQYHTSWGGAWNKDDGSAGGVGDETAAGQHLYSSTATAHFL